MVQKKKNTPYLERDISWMYFNRRILQEATRPHVPLLERMAFLGIYSNNLDEFFRVRMARAVLPNVRTRRQPKKANMPAS